MLFAFSFPCWRCVGCRQVVEWCDAVPVGEDGRWYAVRHPDCQEPE